MSRRLFWALALTVQGAACEPAVPPPPPPVAATVLPSRDTVVSDIRRVVDHELGRARRLPVPSDWLHATLYAGLAEAYAATGDRRLLADLLNRASSLRWRVRGPPRMADHHAVAQLYVALAEAAPVQADLGPVRAHFDSLAAHPTLASDVGWDLWRNWSWADALFMAPPVWAGLADATGDRRYLDAMDAMWWETVELLYDPGDSLFYRDSAWIHPEGRGRSRFGGREVFWGRGNGWVLAGTARVLRHMPDDYPSRPRYEALFREMAARLAGLQQPDGFWRSDLTVPDTFPGPETSVTGLVTHALAWGVAEGVLDRRRYLPVVARAYRGLREIVDEDGVVRWVQPPAQGPGPVRATGAEAYGTGAFLLAAAQVARLAPE